MTSLVVRRKTFGQSMVAPTTKATADTPGGGHPDLPVQPDPVHSEPTQSPARPGQSRCSGSTRHCPHLALLVAVPLAAICGRPSPPQPLWPAKLPVGRNPTGEGPLTAEAAPGLGGSSRDFRSSARTRARAPGCRHRGGLR